MKIALVNLTRGGMSGGYRKYLQQITPRLCGDPRVTRLDVYLPAGVDVPVAADRVSAWEGGGMRAAFAHVRRELARQRPDVVFIPNAQSIDCSVPVVSMIRNMEPLTMPFAGNPWPERARNAARAWAARRAARSSDRVIAVSNHVRDFLVGHWAIEPRKIGVVYHGVDEVVEPVKPAADLPDDFLFTAGSIRPARGLDDLIEALAHVRETLLVAGQPDAATAAYAEQLQRRAKALPVRWLGRLSAAEMSWCFRNCRAFVMTSRAEACPNIVLEAMAHGCLSLSTDCPPMPEFFGQAALYYAARDGHDLAARLTELRAMSGEETDALRERARVRARSFTWEAAASQTIDQLQLALR